MFVSFEGVDGSGKTTQARLLAECLRTDGLEVVETREPGGTALGERVRELVLHGDTAIGPWAEAGLFAAARAELVEEVIRPALARDAAVVCDRYIDSSLAYQGVVRSLGVEAVLELNLLLVQGLLPDCTFLLAVPAELAARRREGPHDRIEREGGGFLAAVGEAYALLARRFSERIVVLDGSKDPQWIAEQVLEHVRRRL